MKNDSNQSRECPLCRTIGPLISIVPGLESAFYVTSNNDNESTTTHAFHPCGHMTSQSTALYWSKIKIPYGDRNYSDRKKKFIMLFFTFFSGSKDLKAVCPFCSLALSETKPFVRLIFQDSIYR